MMLNRCVQASYYVRSFPKLRVTSVKALCDCNRDDIQSSQSRRYRDFGHKPDLAPKYGKYLLFGIVVAFYAITFVDWPAFHQKVSSIKFKEVKAAELVPNEEEEDDKTEEEEEEEGKHEQVDHKDHKKKKNKKKATGFRDRKVIEYENRIRQFSTPDKVFRYFATLQITNPANDTHEVLMTPDDFLRSLTPGVKQPDGLGLDEYKRYDPKTVHKKLELALDENSIFYKLGSSGLITFSDYIFLLTVLSTSRRHFEIAFRMFDVNGDGDVDYEEFNKVSTLIRQHSSIGSRHRDHANTGNTFKGVNSALMTYFFGPDLKQKLKIEKFLEFQELLQREILSLEFERRNPNEAGFISEVDFTELLLAYAGYPEKKKSRIIKTVKKAFKDCSVGIHKEDYLKFFKFLSNISDVDTALTFYHVAGASIDPATLKHVAKTVAHVDLSDHIIKVVYTIFDENMDGQLSNREFVAVMKNRALRGLEKPKDTGFVKFMYSILKCARNSYVNN